MSYSEALRCRICGNTHLQPFLNLGEQALTGVFPRTREAEITVGPLELVKCDERGHSDGKTPPCGLVQLRHSYDPDAMYGENYGYRSGLNQSMVQHLHRRVAKAIAIAKPVAGDVILDIGSNDGTTLRGYPDKGFTLIGMDPTGRKFARFYPPSVRLVADFFTADRFERELPGKRAKIVTSIAMFYDLEAPLAFMTDIHRILADDGIWVFEQSYMPIMLEQNAYDTICHEHLSYYGLKQIKWITDRAGLKIIDVEVNDVNGGSFCVTVAKDASPYPVAATIVDELLAREEADGVSGIETFQSFRERVFAHRDRLSAAVREIIAGGRTIYGYGASTKGNVLLQFCNFGPKEIPAIAEVNEDKFGSFTPRTQIPIRSEAEVRALKPDYLLVLPWHFRASIVRREHDYLASGGRLLFPLPEIEVVAERGGRIVSERPAPPAPRRVP
jgi:hypothetical protein